MGLDTVLPHNTEMEAAIIGAVILENGDGALSRIMEILPSEKIFYEQKHQEVWAAILKLHELGEKIDLLTVTEKLRKIGKLQKAGGAQFVTALTFRVNSSANTEHYSRIITEYAIRRQIKLVCKQKDTEASDHTKNAFDVLEGLESDLNRISNSLNSKEVVSIPDMLYQTLDEITESQEKYNKGEEEGIGFGINKIDAMAGKLVNTDLVLVAARPGMGKTAFMLMTARHAALVEKVPVAIFSLEMPSGQLLKRMLASESGVPVKNIRSGNLSDEDVKAIVKHSGKFTEVPIYIDDTPNISLMELRGKVGRLKRKNNIGLVIIDYLQIMKTTSTKNGNKEQELSDLMLGLKAVCMSLDIPIMALAQLNREVAGRPDKRPMLTDLKGSGSLEAGSDKILFLHRPEYYGITESEDGRQLDGDSEVIVAKNRHGDTGVIHLHFKGETTKFYDKNDIPINDKFDQLGSDKSFF